MLTVSKFQNLIKKLRFRRPLWKKAEDLARKYLESYSLKLVEANYSCSRGEIDIVMIEKKMLVFVEVKFRAGDYFASPFEVITEKKKTSLIFTARHFLSSRTNFRDFDARFDLVVVTPSVDQPMNCEWIKNAFYL